MTFVVMLQAHVHGVRMILLRNLQGAMRLDHSKYMSLHVSNCTHYDFNALTSVVLKLWH
jgi:hypothetical protein